MNKHQAGQGLVEYALLVAVIGLILYVAMNLFGNAILEYFMRGL